MSFDNRSYTKLIMSIDVEDWFQVENLKSAIPFNTWNKREYRLEKNINILLEIMSETNTSATFFVLGWIAKNHTSLVKLISENGHEVSSHGFNHDALTSMNIKSFKEDILKSKNVIEEIIGKKVIGYRAPNLSITDWAVDVLMENGFLYDSSLFPSLMHDRYGKLYKYKSNNETIYEIKKGFYEVSLSCNKIMRQNIPWAGGGYFRLIPYSIYKSGIKRILKKCQYFCFYIHPWELDPEQPKIRNVRFLYKFRHYQNLKNTENKLRVLLKEFKFNKIENILNFTKLN
jgi:polysaccharide deacetylase family protein (PEP-CTERM system associated)